jgi:hypothetical protein
MWYQTKPYFCASKFQRYCCNGNFTLNSVKFKPLYKYEAIKF